MEYGEETGLVGSCEYVATPTDTLKSVSEENTTESSSEEALQYPSRLIKLSAFKPRDDSDSEEEEEEAQAEEEEEEEEDEEEALAEGDRVEMESISTAPESSIVTDERPWINIKPGAILWNEIDRPVVKLLSYEDLVLDEEETNGVLSNRMIACGLSYLGQNPTTKGYILAKLIMSDKSLRDISILEHHHFLQYVDLSWNSLTDLTPLGRIPFLMYLNVSHNELTSVLRFTAPKNLTYVCYSYNKVVNVDDLTDFWSILSLDLSHNSIDRIDGLQNLKFLRVLNLSYNKIQRFENLNNLRITELNLENNLISTFEEGPDIGMKTMMDLIYINISNNMLTSLALFKDVYHLRCLEAMNNEVTELLEIDNLCSMAMLYDLDLSGNPLVNWPDYRNLILNMLNSLSVLDGQKIGRTEKVAAKSTFAPNLALLVARSHAQVLLLEQINGYDIDLDVLPVDQGPFPLVILVGPPGSRKAALMRQLLAKAPGKIRAGVSHTTRPREPEEVDGVKYYFVSREEFNNLASSGIFLTVTEFLGNSYGFARTELAECVRRRVLCITPMDMVGAMTLFKRSIQPRLVLTILENTDKHLAQLRGNYIALTSKSSGAVGIRRRITHFDSPRISIMNQIGNEIIDESSFTSLSNKREQDLSSPNMYPQSEHEIMSNQLLNVDLLDTAVLEEIKKKNKLEKNITNRPSVAFSYLGKRTTSTISEETNDISIVDDTSSEAQFTEEIGEKSDSTYISKTRSSVTVNAVEEMNIRSILQSRETYFSLNDENPGMFSETIYTDDLDKACNKLYKFVKDTYNCRPQQLPVHSVVNDDVYKSMTEKKLTRYMDLIHKHYEITAQQNDVKAFKQPYISQRRASVITSEHQK